MTARYARKISLEGVVASMRGRKGRSGEPADDGGCGNVAGGSEEDKLPVRTKVGRAEGPIRMKDLNLKEQIREEVVLNTDEYTIHCGIDKEVEAVKKHRTVNHSRARGKAYVNVRTDRDFCEPS
jgi:hypothetical protein